MKFPAAVTVVLWLMGLVPLDAEVAEGKAARVPDLVLLSPAKEEFKLAAAFQGRPGLIFFYPGGWDPPSVKVLKDLRNVEEVLTGLQCRIIAITPDRPERIHETLSEHSLPFVILHDSQAAAAKVFDIARRLEEEEIRNKAEYGLDLRERTGSADVYLPRLFLYWVNDRGQILKVDALAELKFDRMEEHLVSRARWILTQSSLE